MIDLVLATVAALLWGGAYGAYFSPDLRRWWRRRRRHAVAWPQARHFAQPPQRPSASRPRPVVAPVMALAPPTPAPMTAKPASNVIPFPRRPRP